MLRDIIEAFKDWLREHQPVLIPAPVQKKDKNSEVSHPGVNRFGLIGIIFISLIVFAVHPDTITAQSTSSTPNDSNKTILFLGDSITAGYGLDETQAFPAIIESKIYENGYQYRVINAGLSGDTSSGGLRRIDWLLRSQVDILVLELGANDGLRGIDLSVTKQNLQSIIDRTKAKNPNVEIVIAGMQVPPNLGEQYTNQFRAMFPTFAASNDAKLIPFLLEGVAGDASLNLPDGIHPNPEGHTILAENVWKVLSEML